MTFIVLAIFDGLISLLFLSTPRRRAYNLTLHKHGELLYEGVGKTIQEHLMTQAGLLKTCPDSVMLQRLKLTWDTHSRDICRIRDILMYMERSYIVNNRKLGTLDLGTLIFRDKILRHEAIRPRVQRLLLDAMRTAREGELVEPLVVRHVLNLLVDLGLGSTGVYVEEFERPFLEQTEAFYREESEGVLSRNCSTVEYLKYAEQRISEETARADALLNSTSLPRLMDVLQLRLIAVHALRLVEVRVPSLCSSSISAPISPTACLLFTHCFMFSADGGQRVSLSSRTRENRRSAQNVPPFLFVANSHQLEGPSRHTRSFVAPSSCVTGLDEGLRD